MMAYTKGVLPLVAIKNLRQQILGLQLNLRQDLLDSFPQKNNPLTPL